MSINFYGILEHAASKKITLKGGRNIYVHLGTCLDEVPVRCDKCPFYIAQCIFGAKQDSSFIRPAECPLREVE